jgi:hypothetical protein
MTLTARADGVREGDGEGVGELDGLEDPLELKVDAIGLHPVAIKMIRIKNLSVKAK